MIAFIKGIVEDIEENKVIIGTENMGYNIFVPASVISKIGRTGVDVKLYTYLSVREDAMVLYGFLSKDDLKLFKQLITVSGIGPKGGLSILSTYTAEELRIAILSGDSKAISKAPGIGTKTASKVILELKDKIDVSVAFADEEEIENVSSGGQALGGIKQDALDGLIVLGYSPSAAMMAVNSVIKNNPDIKDAGELIKFALKQI